MKIIHPTEVDFSWVTMVVVGSAIVVKIILGLFTRGRGKKYNSDSLVASGTDAMMDSIISLATLIGIGIYFIWDLNLDGYIGALISVFIIKAGLEMMFEAIGDVIGKRPDSAITLAIKEDIAKISPVMSAVDLVLHNYGPDQAIGSIHVEIPSSLSADDIHRLTMEIQKTIVEKYHVMLTVGIYAIDMEQKEAYNTIKDIVFAFPGVIGFHGLFIDTETKNMSFDAVVDFTVKDKKKFVEDVINKVKEAYPEYSIYVNLDLNYSD
jgi:divalent metal cation (Fe/Co/Zn/Cd) transporter